MAGPSASNLPAMSDLPMLPVPAPEICSQTVSEASDWFRDAAARISECVDEALSVHERLVEAWGVKCRLRLAAALSLYDPALVEDFFREFPLPSVERLLELAPVAPHDAASFEAAAQFALDIVLGISDTEKKAFPGTVGESIGMTMRNVGGKSFVMTEDGWREQEAIQATPMLPHPGMVASAIFPTTRVWDEAPAPGEADYEADDAPALWLAHRTLWLCYATQAGRFAVVAFDGHVEHQFSNLGPDTLRNHPYAGAGLEVLAFNELSESLQSIYWAPLRARHWVASLSWGALDVIARSVRLVAPALEAANARDALLSAPGFPGDAA